LAEAPSYGVPGVVFDPSSKGAQAFVGFAHELVKRVAPNIKISKPKKAAANAGTASA